MAALVVLALVLMFVALRIFGDVRWNRRSAEMEEGLAVNSEPAGSGGSAVFRASELDGLPEPVQRYFRRVLSEGQGMVRRVEMRQSGTFNMGQGDSDQWKSFTARQVVRPGHPGFLWDARISMMPLMPVRVHDAYIGGEGILHGALFGLITVAEMRGTPEAAEGEFLRFLAEAPWYPTALLPSQGAEWSALDERSARVSLSDGDVAGDMLVRFNENDLIESIHVDARGREVDGEVVPTPWEGEWRDYERHAGMLVPTAGEVAWILPERRKPYWRGTVTDLSYGFGKQ